MSTRVDKRSNSRDAAMYHTALTNGRIRNRRMVYLCGLMCMSSQK